MRVYYMHANPGPSYLHLASDLIEQKPVHTGEWQAMDTRASSMHQTHELEDVSLVWEQVPNDPSDAIPAVDTAWAREHFAERVSGLPLNPAPSHVRWPYAVRGNADHIDADSVFDHTYPERFWPKRAGLDASMFREDHREGVLKNGEHRGIRFHYGDLNDVVSLLLRNPLTRQAYLPIWFPEDTGAGFANDPDLAKFGHGELNRVPCTLGYHFMQRGSHLSMRYYIRSVDFYRHLSNDVYFAVALMRWVCAEIKRRTERAPMQLLVKPGKLVMHIANLHAFTGDKRNILNRIKLVSDYDQDDFIGGAV